MSELISQFACESIRSAKLKLIDDLKDAMVTEFQGLNKVLGGVYRLEEIANRECLWTNSRSYVYTSYEKEMFDRTSFKWLDDLNCLRVQLVRMQTDESPDSNQETSRSGYIESLYECLIDNAINHKKFKIGQVYVEEMTRQEILGNELRRNLKEAQLLMSRQSLKKAKFLLKSNIDEFEKFLNASHQGNQPQIDVYVKSLDLYAQLLSTTQEISPHQIMSEYLEKSVEVVEKEASQSSLNSFQYKTNFHFIINILSNQ